MAQYPNRKECPNCRGQRGFSCPTCRGATYVKKDPYGLNNLVPNWDSDRWYNRNSQKCPTCNAVGVVPCPECRGSGYL